MLKSERDFPGLFGHTFREECAQVGFVALRQIPMSRKSPDARFDTSSIPIASAVPEIWSKEDGGVHFWLESGQK